MALAATFVGSAKGGRQGAGPLTVTPPAGASGYIALVSGGGGTVTPPSGWSKIATGSGGSAMDVYQAGSGAGAEWTFAGAGAWWRGVEVVGLSGGTVIAQSSSIATTAISPSVTTTDPSLVLRGTADGHDANTNVTYPTNATLGRDQWRRWDATYSQTIAIAHSVQSAAGATGTAVWTIPSQWEPQSITIALTVVPEIAPPSGLDVSGGVRELAIDFDPVEGADSYVVGWRRTDLVVPAQRIQAGSGWALDRLDSSPGNGNYSYTFDGTGVRVYVLDSGVRYTHSDFAGRTAPGYNVPPTGTWSIDTEPHGTAVASCAVGTTHGVAKGATMVSVRVCVGPEPSASDYDWAGIGRAFDWIIEDAARRPAVAVYAQLGPEGADAPFHAVAQAAFQKLIDAGIQVVSAMGNSGTSFSHVPTDMAEVVSVGSTGPADAIWTGGQPSSYGPDLDIFAPGGGVPTAVGDGNDSSVATQSGTSFASPIVAGVIARILQGNPALSPVRVREVLYSQARHVVTGAPSGQTGLVYGNANTDAWSTTTTSSPTLTLDGLDADATYEIRVATMHAGVVSGWSGVDSATTRAANRGPRPMAGGQERDGAWFGVVGGVEVPAVWFKVVDQVEVPLS